MSIFYLIPVIVVLLFSLTNNSCAADDILSGGSGNYQADYDLYIDQTVTGKGPNVEMGDDATGVTEETIIAASIVKVSATIRTGIMTGILGAVLLVSGSVVYWRMRRMNS